MNIKNIILHNYRNYKQLNMDLSPNINIFIGYNAQGKTNIIEAVHFAAIGISHRTRRCAPWGARPGRGSARTGRRSPPAGRTARAGTPRRRPCRRWEALSSPHRAGARRTPGARRSQRAPCGCPPRRSGYRAGGR